VLIPQALQAQSTLLRVAPHVLSGAQAASPLPNWSDEDAVRDWLRGILPAVEAVARLTLSTLDDASVAMLHVLVDDDFVWAAAYSGALDMLEGPSEGQCQHNLAVAFARGRYTFPPAVAAAVVGVVAEIAKLVIASTPRPPAVVDPPRPQEAQAEAEEPDDE